VTVMRVLGLAPLRVLVGVKGASFSLDSIALGDKEPLETERSETDDEGVEGVVSRLMLRTQASRDPNSKRKGS
jgi:hypothetical protein